MRFAKAATAAIVLVGAALFAVATWLDAPLLRIASKPIPVLGLALWAVTPPFRGRYQALVATGLVCGAIGDLLLELSQRTFLAGLLAFLVGHVAYAGAFLQDSRRLAPTLALAAFAPGAAVMCLLWRAGHLGDLTVPVAVYMFVICTMLWRALSRLTALSAPRSSAYSGALGAAVFLVSDAILAIDLFVARVPHSETAILATYWCGQFGIALSAQSPRRTVSSGQGPEEIPRLRRRV